MLKQWREPEGRWKRKAETGVLLRTFQHELDGLRKLLCRRGNTRTLLEEIRFPVFNCLSVPSVSRSIC